MSNSNSFTDSPLPTVETTNVVILKDFVRRRMQLSLSVLVRLVLRWSGKCLWMVPVSKFASFGEARLWQQTSWTAKGVTAPQGGQYQRKTTGLQFALHAPRGFREEGKTHLLQLLNIKSSIFAHHIFLRGWTDCSSDSESDNFINPSRGILFDQLAPHTYWNLQ